MKYENAFDTVRKLYVESIGVSPSQNPQSSVDVKVAGRGMANVFLAGLRPRVIWISLGGFFFFGAYEQASLFLKRMV